MFFCLLFDFFFKVTLTQLRASFCTPLGSAGRRAKAFGFDPGAKSFHSVVENGSLRFPEIKMNIRDF